MQETTIRAITVCQPWAWALVNGPRDGVAWKRFENRGQEITYRGPLVIHAGKSRDWMDAGLKFLREFGAPPLISELHFGAVLGVVDLVDAVRQAETSGPRSATDPEIVRPDPFAFGPWCMKTARPRRLATPVPLKGQLGLFKVPRSIVAELLDDQQGSVVSGQGSVAETKEERIAAAVAATGGRVGRIKQVNLW